MEQEKIINEVAKDLGIVLKETNYAFNKQQLIEKINELVANDFQKLFSILYRMDVSEVKLRTLLRDNPDTDAGILIADLMIEREAQKIKSRKESKSKSDGINEDDKW